MTTFISSLIRHLFTLGGGVLLSSGIVSDSDIQVISAGIATLIAVGWSFAEKKLLSKK